MNLSEHFTLDEMTVSQEAARFGMDNQPSDRIIKNLRITAQGMEAVRVILGNRPILISSAYRSPAVNQRVGGVSSSAHVLGWAVDFICPSFGNPFQVCEAIQASGLMYDQLIHEFGRWTHISFDPRQRHQSLTIASARRGYTSGICHI